MRTIWAPFSGSSIARPPKARLATPSGAVRSPSATEYSGKGLGGLPVDNPGTVLGLWEEAVNTPEFDDRPVWLHGDLHPANLLVVDRRLSGVIDFGDITGGAPATDLAVAWMLFPGEMRAQFRRAYEEVDEATWTRADGWSLSLALAYLTHFSDNEEMRSIGELTLARAINP